MSGRRPTLRQLEIADLRNLSISDENELYWKGERIEVRHRLRLTRPQAIGAFLVGTAAVFGGVATGLNDGTEFTCRHWQLFCGGEPKDSGVALPGHRDAAPS
jgi:hypothetical protein